MIKISSRNRHKEHGLTLTELLITLAILSLVVGLSSAWIGRSIPRLAVQQTSNLIESDLKLARLNARLTGDEIELSLLPDGYEIKQLEIKRQLNKSVDIIWETTSPLVFASTKPAPAGSIKISKGRAYAVISIDPFTRQISLQ